LDLAGCTGWPREAPCGPLQYSLGVIFNDMAFEHTTESKDAAIQDAFVKLGTRIGFLVNVRGSVLGPQERMSEPSARPVVAFANDLRRYLANHATVRRAFEMFFTIIAMAARAQWRDAPEQFRGVAARGWFLGRWIPTFLIIDGPVGRFIVGKDSPLANRLTGDVSPMLASARGFLNDRTFLLLRNGFAHWAFDWEVVGPDQYVVAYDYERDLPTAKLHLEEADAYHIIAFAIIEVLNEAFISPAVGMTPNQRMEPTRH